METSTTGPRSVDPFFDPARMQPGHGAPVDWSRVSAYFEQGKFTVQLNGAVAIGAESLTVDALEFPLQGGQLLDFGTYDPVVVTTSGATAGATSIPVTALTGPIPNGTVLDFAGAGEFAKLTAAAAAGATSLTVEAIDATIENLDTATFPGGNISATVVDDVDAGATTVAVEPVQFPIGDDSQAIAKRRDAVVGRRIPKGTVIAKTSAGLLIPRRDADAEEAVGFIVSDADERSVSDSKSGYGIIVGGTGIYENLCPDALDNGGDLPSAYKTELAANTLGFWYLDYEDTRI